MTRAAGEEDTALAGGGAAPSGIADVLRLSWPSVLSFVCNSAYRVNDQYWVKGLGDDAHAALGGSTFLAVLNFAVVFLASAGALPLIARATGANDGRGRESTIRHALALGAGIAVVLGLVGTRLSPTIPLWLGLDGEVARLCSAYLFTIYLFLLPIALAPIVDTVFIGMGNTRVPLLLQGTAVVCNFVLNPCLIFGWGPFEAQGIAGAALATCISRGVGVGLGLAILQLHFRVCWFRELRLSLAEFATTLRIGFPSAVSIAIYAGVYLALMRLVISGLGRDTVAALGIGFNAFEGVSFPFYLGIAIAGSSLIGRNLGAGRKDLALDALRNVRRVGHALGAGFGLIFVAGADQLVTHFTNDPAVVAETVQYVRILGLSQLFVAAEAVNEKTLLGAGTTAPIFWISVPGNVLRIPLAWFLATHLGYGAAGVWWAINATTCLKALAFWWIVERRRWLR